MDDVRVSLTESSDGWTAEVVVTGGGSNTRHEVTLSRDAYERLADGKAFAFLLEREPKESILRHPRHWSRPRSPSSSNASPKNRFSAASTCPSSAATSPITSA